MARRGAVTLPARLEEVASELRALPPQLRVEVLLDYSERMPQPPAHLRDDPWRMEQVTECQTPFFVAVEVDGDARVTIHFDCPPDAPTQRGFAGLLAAGLNGATTDEVLAVPADVGARLGLGEAISTLRLQGLQAILVRVQRQVELARRAGA